MHIGEEARAWLPAGELGGRLYAYPSIDSTNSRAGQLAREGEPHGTVVLADGQTGGRGRRGSHWHSPPGASVALSLILRPTEGFGPRWAGLGALAVAEALEAQGLEPRIKWPNDVLLRERKAAGVLAEAAWEGDRLAWVVLGIGVNVGADSQPPAAQVDFPATTVETIAGRPVLRVEVIAEVVAAVGRWLPRLGSAEFLRAWQRRLAYAAEEVVVETTTGELRGRVLGLAADGSLRLTLDSGEVVPVGAEAARLRPVDRQAE